MMLSLLSSVATMAGMASASLPSIEIVGNKFFYSNNGSQFYIKGVAYQSNSLANETSSTTFHDPLADVASCKRDIPYLQKLSTNVIRVYAVNASLDHSECMEALDAAGIYVISDLSEPGLSINRDSPSWDTALFSRYTSVVDSLANYTNVLGFFAGNEVTNAKNNTDSAPFVRAAVRDVKSYIKQKGYRSIPVGYSASDDADVRVPEANYFACGDDSSHADFYGVNMYEWCGNSTFETSGYKDRTQEMANMSIPLFFSEYGCNAVQPRTFQETGELYSSDMTGVWSGGIVYMYFQEENDYGLVSVSGSSVSTLEDFGYLSKALATVSPSIAQASGQTQSTSHIACPATSQLNWAAATNLPPTPDAGVCECLTNSAQCSVADSVSEDDYGSLFGYICGVDNSLCNAILGNGTSGEYGAFAACSPKQKLNYVLNQYYQQNSGSSNACGFNGQAQLNSNVNTASSCAAYFSSVGASGTGTLAQGSSLNVASATSTGSAAKSGSSSTKSGKTTSSSSGSSASGSSSSTKSSAKNAAPSEGGVKVAAGVLGGVMAILFGAL